MPDNVIIAGEHPMYKVESTGKDTVRYFTSSLIKVGAQVTLKSYDDKLNEVMNTYLVERCIATSAHWAGYEIHLRLKADASKVTILHKSVLGADALAMSSCCLVAQPYYYEKDDYLYIAVHQSPRSEAQHKTYMRNVNIMGFDVAQTIGQKDGKISTVYIKRLVSGCISSAAKGSAN